MSDRLLGPTLTSSDGGVSSSSFCASSNSWAGDCELLMEASELRGLPLERPVRLTSRLPLAAQMEQLSDALQRVIRPAPQRGGPRGRPVHVAALMRPAIAKHEAARQQPAQGLVGAVAVADEDDLVAPAQL